MHTSHTDSTSTNTFSNTDLHSTSTTTTSTTLVLQSKNGLFALLLKEQVLGKVHKSANFWDPFPGRTIQTTILYT